VEEPEKVIYDISDDEEEPHEKDTPSARNTC
jgi:hypothetical protein